MNRKPGGELPIQRFSQKKYGHPSAPFRRPAWLPAPSYYALTAAAALIFYLLIWGIFHDGNEDGAWLIAAVGAAAVTGASVVLREVYLRDARNRYLKDERNLDYNLRNFQIPARSNREENKISLEKNALIIKSIEKKSEAARILSKVSSGHLEVSEICREYLSMAEKQMETAGAGSPRLAGLRRGREIVGELHRFHLLSWAEIESRALTQKAGNYATMAEKITTAQMALSVLNTALQHYPNEPQLTESETVIKGFIGSIKVSHWIEQAERAAFKGNYKRAVNLYQDALFFLAREGATSAERDAIAEKINIEITNLRRRAATEKINKGID